MMKPNFKQFLGEALGVPEESLPSGFQRIGDVIILRLEPVLDEHAKRIGELVLEHFPKVKSVCRSLGVRGQLREPRIQLLAGKGTVTTHRENGCLFKIDVSKLMFAKGNVSERGRVPKLVKDSETIVDMFAGIGYFTIPVAKLAKPKKIHAIELNTEAVKYLRENIKLNHVGNVEVIQGDCRSVELGKVADRVLMGYLPKTYEFLPAAFGFLKPEGGILHYHDTFRKEELWDKPLEILRKAAGEAGYELKSVTHEAVVKQYAPGVEHVVIDAEFRRNE